MLSYFFIPKIKKKNFLVNFKSMVLVLTINKRISKLLFNHFLINKYTSNTYYIDFKVIVITKRLRISGDVGVLMIIF